MKLEIALMALLLSACKGSPNEAKVDSGPPKQDTVAAGGEWGIRAELIERNSEFALAESNGKLYVLGGYPPSRQTSRVVQIYDVASDRWQLGPQLPQPNNH